MVAVGFDFIRRLGLHVIRDPGQQDGSGVGKVVAGIGEERQGVRFEPGDYLHDYKQEGGKQRPAEDAACAAMLMMGVPVHLSTV